MDLVMKFVIEMVDSVNVKQTIKEEPVKSVTMVSTIIPIATVSIRGFSILRRLFLLNYVINYSGVHRYLDK